MVGDRFPEAFITFSRDSARACHLAGRSEPLPGPHGYARIIINDDEQLRVVTTDDEGLLWDFYRIAMRLLWHFCRTSAGLL